MDTIVLLGTLLLTSIEKSKKKFIWNECDFKSFKTTAGYILTCQDGIQVSFSCKILSSFTDLFWKKNRKSSSWKYFSACGVSLNAWAAMQNSKLWRFTQQWENWAELKIIPWIFEPFEAEGLEMWCPTEFRSKEAVTVTIGKKSFKQTAKIVKHLSCTAQREAQVPDVALSGCSVPSEYRQRTAIQEYS